MGNKYSVDLTVRADLHRAAEQDELSQTVNYEALYTVVAEEMVQKSRLLEHIGYNIIHAIFNQFPPVDEVEISISKSNPPIGGVCQEARVTLKEHRNNHK